MAQLKAQPEQQKGMLTASTLLETLIAMVIILVVFTLAIGIYNHVLSYTPTARYEQAKTLCNGVIEQSIMEENWTDAESMQDSILLKKTVLPYEKYADLVLITVTAVEQEKQIGLCKRIVKKTAHE